MRSLPLVALLTVSSAFAINGASFSADSKRGALIFASQMCTNCHSVLGRGANTALDLGRRLDRTYTPAGIASLMWNHAPAMWSAIPKLGIPMRHLADAHAADRFAY